MEWESIVELSMTICIVDVMTFLFSHYELYVDDLSPVPFTIEHLLPELMCVASKWQALGEALSLDEDHLDEIFTNNETDEACLHEMLEHYMMRSDLQHSWEEVATAVKKIREETTICMAEGTQCMLHS